MIDFTLCISKRSLTLRHLAHEKTWQCLDLKIAKEDRALLLRNHCPPPHP